MSRNGPKTNEEARLKTFLDCSKEPSKTIQSDANAADINKIIARLARTDSLALLGEQEQVFADVSELGGLQESYMKVQKAEELFMKFPAEIRERFENDPVKIIEFLGDEKNRKEAEDIGMIPKKAEVVPVISPAIPAK